jgi:catechol 2,3-dioxygenase-like lactoylglutathione lyase family enzyme
MSRAIPGLHHVTAISGPPQVNVDFYVETMGQRLVKRTVNFDAPGTYHLYYGDRTGSPGTILTFFVRRRGAGTRRGLIRASGRPEPPTARNAGRTATQNVSRKSLPAAA